MTKKQSPMEDVETPEIVAPAPKSEEDSQALVHVHDAELYLAMEKRDEGQIVAALEGRYLEDFVYEMEVSGRKVTGLSWIGIQEASREYGGIECKLLEERSTDLHIIVTIEAKDIKTGSVRIGRSKQPHRMKLKSGKFVTDDFCDVKAISKAQRNAIRQLLPQTLLKQWIDHHLAGKPMPPPKAPVPPPPPPPAPPPSQEPAPPVIEHQEPPPAPPPSQEPAPGPAESAKAPAITDIAQKVRDWAEFLFPGEKNKKKQNNLIRAMGTDINDAGEMTHRPDLRQISDEELKEIYSRAENVVLPKDAERVLILGSYQAWLSEQEDLPF